jgi:hypothetical protein
MGYSENYLMRVNAEGGDAFIAGSIVTGSIGKIAFYDDSTLYLSSPGGILQRVNVKIPHPVPTVLGNMGTAMGTIAFHPKTKELWGAATDRIYRIKVSPKVDTVRVGVTGLGQSIKDLAFDARGNLYGLSGNNLIRIDTANGGGTLIGPLGITTVNSITLLPYSTTGVGTIAEETPLSYHLDQNYPNPFNPSTTIRYDLPRSSMVRLSVYDILGREVSVLVNERRDAGVHEVKFDGLNYASGVYFYRLQAGDFVQTRKLLILR